MLGSHTTGEATQARFDVCFVCTGNRARSAVAEALLQRHVAGQPVAVRSVGTLDVGALPALPEALRAGAQLGVDLTGHRASPLSLGALAASDLVLGFEASHLSVAVIDGRARRECAFSIVELSDILVAMPPLSGADAASPARLLQLAHARRRPDLLSAPSIADPLGASEGVFRETFAEIDRRVASIARVLFPRLATTAGSPDASG